jgi:hypothetical protein
MSYDRSQRFTLGSLRGISPRAAVRAEQVMILSIHGQVVETLSLWSRDVDETDVLERLPEGRARNERDHCAAHNTSVVSAGVRMAITVVSDLSWDEKLRAMEELWESLTQDEARLESPPWHQDALRETTARYEGGLEQPVDLARRRTL